MDKFGTMTWPFAKPAVPTDRAAAELAFEEVFRAFWPKIHAVLTRMVEDPDEAQDLALETFSRLYDRFDSLAEDERVGGWLYRTAVNLGLNALRRSARQRRYEEQSFRQNPAGTSTNPAGEVEAAETRRQVRQVLLGMKERSARLLLLRYAGLSYAELAAALDLPAGSVGTTLARAEREFTWRYREKYGEPK